MRLIDLLEQEQQDQVIAGFSPVVWSTLKNIAPFIYDVTMAQTEEDIPQFIDDMKIKSLLEHIRDNIVPHI